MGQKPKTAMFIILLLVLSLSVLSVGCKVEGPTFLSGGQRAVQSAGIDHNYADMRIEETFNSYKMGDGVIVHKLTFTEDVSALFKDWNELPTDDEDLYECLRVAEQAWVTHGIKDGRWIIKDRTPEGSMSKLLEYTVGVYDADENIAYIVEYYLGSPQ